MFSMVKEASIIKEKDIKAKLQHHNKSMIMDKESSPSKNMKASVIGEINILSKKSRATRIEEDELDE
jgi:hypothetical protein